MTIPNAGSFFMELENKLFKKASFFCTPSTFSVMKSKLTPRCNKISYLSDHILNAYIIFNRLLR